MEDRVDFYFAVGEVVLAHKWEFATGRGCAYPAGRLEYGWILALSGEVEYRFANGVRQSLCAGESALVPIGIGYRVTAKAPFSHMTVNFRADVPTSHPAALREMLAARRLLLAKMPDLAAAEQDTLRLIAHFQGKRPGYRMVAHEMLVSLMRRFFLCLLGETPDSIARLAPAKELLEDLHAQTPDIPELAVLCHLSPTHFRRLFFRSFGMTAQSYRDKCRLTLAKELLSAQIGTVAEIAEACGFADANYFSRFFRKHSGCTPTQYRHFPLQGNAPFGESP